MASMINVFLKYMAADHPEELKEFIINYPENKTFTIEWQTLKRYNNDLAELIKIRPIDMLSAFRNKLIEISELPENAEIYFDIIHYDNIVELSDISSKHIGELIKFDANIKKIYDVHPMLDEAIFECQGCMRITALHQNSQSKIIEPLMCPECGGRSFRLCREESSYQDSQRIDIGLSNTNQELPLMMYNDLCSWDDYKINDNVSVLGIVDTFKSSKNKPLEKYVRVINIKVIKDESPDEFIDEIKDRRNTPEYKEWVNKVIDNSNGVCACCGADKHLHAHHSFSYEDYPELRLNPENGVALCKWCHGKYHSYYYDDINPRSLMEFFSKFGVVKK